MKKVISAIGLVFCIAVFVFGFVLANGKGTTYEFQQTEFIENYQEADLSQTVGKPVQNTGSEAQAKVFKDMKVSALTYKSNVKLTQAQYRLMETASGKKFSKSYSFKIPDMTETLEPGQYGWVVFRPEMNKLAGYIIQKEGGQEVKKTYVEVVYPVADPSNSKKAKGEVIFKTDDKKPPEKLS